jgi:predicted transcriptional regulator
LNHFDIHIGKLIRIQLESSRLKVTEFAKLLHVSRSGVYKLFLKKDIDTLTLTRISHLLNHDFFSYYAALSNHKARVPNLSLPSKSEVKHLQTAIQMLTEKID